AVETSFGDSQNHRSGSTAIPDTLKADSPVGKEVAKAEATEDPSTNDEEEGAGAKSTHQAKTPWQELWDSLTALA
ncbi:hypothetical protein LTR16_006262, partial [Cryomyces antarcticus]